MSAENNGGTTSYYDLPLPDRKAIQEILLSYSMHTISLQDATEGIRELCPQTLNDLIEAKGMKPWMHEVMKACYALTARAEKNGGSVVREINKIIYYAGRGLAIMLKEQK